MKPNESIEAEYNSQSRQKVQLKKLKLKDAPSLPLTLKLKPITPMSKQYASCEGKLIKEENQDQFDKDRISIDHSSIIESSTPESIRRKINPVKRRE
jgi:hypothetical protein